MDSQGDFVIAWSSYHGSGYAVFAQRYNASGAVEGSAFQVNSTLINSIFFGDQAEPSVAMDAAGDFVVAWTGSGNDPLNIVAQRYNAAGVAQGSQIQVSSVVPQGVPLAASVSMDSTGDFAVAWLSEESGGIYARRYNASGVAQGSQFEVNTFTTVFQGAPSTAMDASGDLVIAWSSYNEEGNHLTDIYAQSL